MVLMGFLPYTATLAQTDRSQAGGIENFLSIQSIPPPESQSGAPVLDHSECLPQAERVRIQAEVRATIDALQAAGKLAAPQGAVQTTLFKWPTRAKAGYSEPGYFTVQNFVDHDNLGASLRDYNCGRRTYDFGANNGHKGTDILLWPFPWRSMDEGVMEVLAAAKGVIVRKQTGAADRNCLNGGSIPWNGVILRHADGTQSWYIHFKRGAAFITNKVVGDSVQVGEFLGVSGSSGLSNWPHLHFEVQNSFGDMVDPFFGACNPTTATTLWQQQIPYEVPSVNRLIIKNSTREYRVCPNPEITYAKDTFNLGDTLALWAYIRDHVTGTPSATRIKNPSGVTAISYTNRNTGSTFTTAYQYWWWLVDNTWTPGRWTWEFDLGGRTYTKTFFMTGRVASTSKRFALKRLQISPNPASGGVSIVGLVPSQPYILRDVRGAICASGKGAGYVSLQALSKGIYTLYAEGFMPERVVVE